MLPFVSVMGHTVPVYGALGILGFLLGMLFILLAAPRFGLKRDDAAYIYVFAALGGLAGAKLLYILTVLPELAELIRAGAGAQELMGYVSGGLVFFGGVFGALPAAYLSARAYRVKLADFYAAPAVFRGYRAQLAFFVKHRISGKLDGFDEECGVVLRPRVALAVLLVRLDLPLLDFDVGRPRSHVGRVGAHGFLVEGGQRRGREGRGRREREQAD